MHITEVDERDSRWENPSARYRMYSFSGPDLRVSTHDYTDVDLGDVLAAGARGDRADALWSLALVVDDSTHGRGLTWLTGMDYNDFPDTPAEWRARRVMQDRFLMAASQRGQNPPLLPDGRRVIRLFCDHGRDWPLWESFTDKYTMDPDDYGLSESLRTDLHAWNQTYQLASLDDPPSPAWIEEGWRLFRMLRAEVDDFAEVRPEFDHGDS